MWEIIVRNSQDIREAGKTCNIACIAFRTEYGILSLRAYQLVVDVVVIQMLGIAKKCNQFVS